MPQINPNEPLDIEWRHGQLCWSGSNNPSVRIVNGVNGTEQQQHHNVQRLETIATRWESRPWAQEEGWGAVSFGFSSFCDFFFFTQKQGGRGRLVPRCPPLDPPLGTREELWNQLPGFSELLFCVWFIWPYLNIYIRCDENLKTSTHEQMKVDMLASFHLINYICSFYVPLTAWYRANKRTKATRWAG